MDSTWTKVKRKAFKAKSLESMIRATHQETTGLKRVLGRLDLVTMGVGCVIGAGVFVLTGEVAREHSGPAILLSYGIAALAALFSALCYAEFAADVPISGSVYNYVGLTFGEFISWMAGSSMLMEYLLSVSTVAKGFSGYFCTFVGLDSDALIIKFDSNDEIVIDILGAVMVVLLTALLAYGVRESFTFNVYATLFTICTVVFIIIAATPKIDTDNYTPFFPLGEIKAVRAASIVFFSYIGFDSLATMAEEAANPGRDMPMSILITMAICTTVYMLMSGAIVGMLPYNEIDIHAPYSTAFEQVGMKWAGRVVSLGASFGIITSMFSTACALFRIMMVFGREGFLPAFLGRIHPYTQTPLYATLLGGSCCALLTLLLDIGTLSNLVSMGTLFAFFLVCLASVWRRFYTSVANRDDGNVEKDFPTGLVVRLIALVVFSILEGLAVDQEWSIWIWVASVVCFIAVVLSFYTLPVVYVSQKFSLPFQPFPSSLGVLFTIHLIVTLGSEAYIRFIVWQAIATVIYFVYSVHHTREDTEPEQPMLLETDAAVVEECRL